MYTHEKAHFENERENTLEIIALTENLKSIRYNVDFSQPLLPSTLEEIIRSENDFDGQQDAFVSEETEIILPALLAASVYARAQLNRHMLDVSGSIECTGNGTLQSTSQLNTGSCSNTGNNSSSSVSGFGDATTVNGCNGSENIYERTQLTKLRCAVRILSKKIKSMTLQQHDRLRKDVLSTLITCAVRPMRRVIEGYGLLAASLAVAEITAVTLEQGRLNSNSIESENAAISTRNPPHTLLSVSGTDRKLAGGKVQ